MVFLLPAEWAAGAFLAQDGGYVSDVRLESHEEGEPLVLIPVPESIRAERPLSESIFNEPLTKEFTKKYEDTFGHTEAEISYREANQFGYFDTSQGQWVTASVKSEREREFGTYMFRRMAEYHFDSYSKNQENLKPVQNLKERVTNYEVSVAPGYSLKTNYSVAGNYVDAKFINPFVGSEARLEMDPRALGPSTVRELRVVLSRDINSRLGVETRYTVYDGILSLITRRKLTPNSVTYVSYSTFLKSEGPSRREHLSLIGYGLTF